MKNSEADEIFHFYDKNITLTTRDQQRGHNSHKLAFVDRHYQINLAQFGARILTALVFETELNLTSKNALIWTLYLTCTGLVLFAPTCQYFIDNFCFLCWPIKSFGSEWLFVGKNVFLTRKYSLYLATNVFKFRQIMLTHFNCSSFMISLAKKCLSLKICQLNSNEFLTKYVWQKLFLKSSLGGLVG